MSESMRKHKSEAPERLKFGVFICSTSRYKQQQKGERAQDISGELIESFLKDAGHEIAFRKLIPDDKTVILENAEQALSAAYVDVIVFCGGTGITSSDVTIETVSPLIDKMLPGFGEVFRRLSFDKVGSGAILSRAIAGTAGKKAVFCIPGSPDAVRLCFERLILTEAAHIVKHARE
jgi:molybdenum cofactor biosynthesis protein B